MEMGCRTVGYGLTQPSSTDCRLVLLVVLYMLNLLMAILSMRTSVNHRAHVILLLWLLSVITP